MQAKDIFFQYLIQDKEISLELYSIADVRMMLGTLRMYKSRYDKQLAGLGMLEQSPVNGRVVTGLVTTLVEDALYKVSIKLTEPKVVGSKIPFKIITSDGDNSGN